ncbi:MAG: HEAT repeat domain-containing protein [Gemmataceae bacterium]
MSRRLAVVLAALVLALGSPAAGRAAERFLHKEMAQWRRDLESKDPALRRSAAFALGQLGALASFTVEDLERHVRGDRDAGVREMAVQAIGDIVGRLRSFPPNREWETAGKALEEALLRDDQPRVRQAAAYAVGSFGPVAASATPALRKALRDASPLVRQNTAWALGRVMAQADRDTVDDLCGLLAEPSPLVRRDAAGALGALGTRLDREPLRPAAAALLRQLGTEKDEVVRKTALGALASLADETHRAAVGPVVPLLGSRDPETMRLAAYVLANVGGEPARRALPYLRRALRESDPQGQAVAAAYLANAGLDAAEAAADLAHLVRTSTHPEVRRNAAIALGRIADGLQKESATAALEALAKVAVPALEAMAKPVAGLDPRAARAVEEGRGYAAEALGRIGYPYNRAALPTVRDLLRADPNPNVRLACVWCLFGCDRLDEYKLTPILEGVLAESGDESRWVRYEVARVLAWAQRERSSDRTCATLVRMIGTRGMKVYQGTGTAVAGVGDEGQKGSSRATNASGGDARYLAATAMGWLGVKGRKNPQVMAALQEAAREADPKLREAATKSLAALKGAD